MGEVISGPWWVIAGASLPTVASGLWIGWRWWIERNDRVDDAEVTAETNLRRDLEAQRVALSREAAELLATVTAEANRLRARLTAVEEDRDRGWALARWWNDKAHELRHALSNATSNIRWLCGKTGDAIPEPADLALPEFEQPIPRSRGPA